MLLIPCSKAQAFLVLKHTLCALSPLRSLQQRDHHIACPEPGDPTLPHEPCHAGVPIKLGVTLWRSARGRLQPACHAGRAAHPQTGVSSERWLIWVWCCKAVAPKKPCWGPHRAWCRPMEVSQGAAGYDLPAMLGCCSLPDKCDKALVELIWILELGVAL
eukprot:1157086-Pelagomonas_calceolata.AAC.2